MKIETGFLETKDYKTYYKIVGDLSNGNIPLIVLHGGPGGNMRSYEPFFALADKGIPIVLYNQHGSYLSPISGDIDKLFTFDSFEEELELLLKKLGIKKYHLLGHSWGGMLALHYVLKAKNIDGIQSLILYSTLPSTELWNDECKRLIKHYPNKMREELLKTYDNPEYVSNLEKRGVKKFLREHNNNKPQDVYKYKEKKIKFIGKTYKYMWGSSELFGTGTLKDYNLIKDLHNINLPTLIMSGQEDESTPFINKLMNDEIKDSKWILYGDSQHCSYLTETDKVLYDLEDWIKNH